MFRKSGRSVPANLVFGFVLIAVSLATPALAQRQSASRFTDAVGKASAQDLANAGGYSNVGFNPDVMSIPGKPFTATRVYTEHRGSAGDSEKSVEVTIARDSLGRVHYESAAVAGGPIGVMIYDPVGHTISEYSISPQRGIDDDAVAKVTRLKPVGNLSHPIASLQSAAAVSGASSELEAEAQPAAQIHSAAPKAPAASDLPERSINGVRAIGYRTALNFASTGLLMVQEDWFSPEYAINLRQMVLRQNTVESTVETRDVIPGEPDPDLFRVPGGYSISR